MSDDGEKKTIVSDEMAKKFASEKETPYVRWVRDQGLEIIDSVYVKNLRNLAKDTLEGDLIAKLKGIEQKYLPILKKEAFLLSEFPWESIIERADNLLKVSQNEKKLLELYL